MWPITTAVAHPAFTSTTQRFTSNHPRQSLLSAGKFVVVLDDEDRENEGDLIINADKVTTEAMAFMVEHTSGVVSGKVAGGGGGGGGRERCGREEGSL